MFWKTVCWVDPSLASPLLSTQITNTHPLWLVLTVPRALSSLQPVSPPVTHPSMLGNLQPPGPSPLPHPLTLTAVLPQSPWEVLQYSWQQGPDCGTWTFVPHQVGPRVRKSFEHFRWDSPRYISGNVLGKMSLRSKKLGKQDF